MATIIEGSKFFFAIKLTGRAITLISCSGKELVRSKPPALTVSAYK